MANSIALFKKYIDTLDEVYKLASMTSDLDGDNSLVQAGANTSEIIVPKLSMQGLGDYSRSSGFVGGDVTLTNETVQCNFDRGRSFTVDAMDNEESAGVAFGKLAAEFIRSKVVPELDAFRFAKYAGTSNILTVNAAVLSAGADVQAALIAAQNAMDEQEVPYEGRILYITPSLYNLFENLDTTKSRAVLASFGKIVKVPQTRFYTVIDQYDGSTSGEEAGGFIKDATTGKNINFMIIHKSAPIQFQKHVVSKIITPELNQDADGWKFCFRDYGIADVYDNKVKGVYLHKSTS